MKSFYPGHACSVNVYVLNDFGGIVMKKIIAILGINFYFLLLCPVKVLAEEAEQYIEIDLSSP